MRKALLLYNPISGRKRAQRLRDVEDAAKALVAGGAQATVEAMMGPGTAAGQARAAAGKGYDAVIVCGGDGSAHEVLQGLVGSDCALGLVPLGTGNALANDLKLPRDPAAAAAMLLRAKAVPLRLPKIEFENPVETGGERSRYFIVGAGMGADAQLTYKLTLAFKQRWGMTAYYTEAWRQWMKYDFPLFEVEFRQGDGQRREQVSQVLAIRVEWFGGFLRRLAPGASLHRNDLRLVLVKSRRRWPYLRYVTGLQFGRAWLGKEIELVYASELRCRATGEQTIYAEGDGELLATLPVSVKMTDQTVKLLVP